MYKHHSIALNQKDQAIYEKVNKATGLAVTAIFRKMLYSLEKVVDTPTIPEQQTAGQVEEE